MASQQSFIPVIRPEDLQDPNLFRLNSTLDLLAQQINKVQGGSGDVRFLSSIWAPEMRVDQANPPIDPSVLLTRGSADQLYGLDALRRQIITRKQGVTPLPGLPGTGGSGGGGDFVQSYDYRLRNVSTPVPDSITRDIRDKVSESVSVLDFGALGDGTTDDSTAINDAITQMGLLGGRAIKFPGGRTYAVASPILLNSDKIVLFGDGPSSIIKRTADMPAGAGLFDVGNDGCAIFNLLIEGDVTTPVGLEYGAGVSPPTGFNNDPMSPNLTLNTSIWVKPGVDGFEVAGVTIQHTGGYAILVDSDTDNIRGIDIHDMLMQNNRPNLFGLAGSGDLTYGAWTGGILIRGDCRTSTSKPYAVSDLSIYNVEFYRCDGNCIWMHSMGFDVQHQNFSIVGNVFKNIARDGILLGNLAGASVIGNTMTNVGVTTLTDSDAPVWKYLADNYAVGYDCSGFVSGVVYSNNSVDEFYGGGFDLDGMRNSIVLGNTLKTTQAIAKGIQTGDTSGNGGGDYMIIASNYISGCNAGGIVLNQAANSVCSSNIIDHPTVSTYYPISLYSTSAATTGNRVTGNFVNCLAALVAVKEDGGSFVGCTNYVWNNSVLNGSPEFDSDAASSSVTGYKFSSNQPGLTTEEYSLIQREGDGVTRALKVYDRSGGTTDQLIQLQGDNALLNVSRNGAVQTGIITTANRNTLGFDDAMWTGKLMSDGFLAVYDYQGTGTSYQAADANALTDDWFLLRYDKATSIAEYSVSETAGVRDWVPLNSGSGTPGGANKYVQYNNSGAFGGSINFQWDNALQLVTILGLTGTPGLAVGTSYIQSDEGFFAPLATGISYQTVNIPGGGVYSRSGHVEKYIHIAGNSGVPSATTGTSVPLNGMFYYDTGLNKFRAYENGAWVDMIGGGSISGLTTGRVPYATSATTIGNTVLYWDNANSRLGVNQATPGTTLHVGGQAYVDGVAAGAGLTVADGYTYSDEGYQTPHPQYNSISAANGGAYVRSGHFEKYIHIAGNSGVPTATAGTSVPVNGMIYYDTGTNKFQAYQNGAWVDMIGGGISGLTAGRMPYATSATVIANTVVYWDNANSRMGVNKAVPGTTLHVGGQGYFDGVASGAGITCADGYVLSDEGFLTSIGVYNSFQNTSGGVYVRSLRATTYTQLGNSSSTPSVTSGDSFAAGAIYWDTFGTAALKVYNGSTWVAITTGGITTINSLSGPAITISRGTGIGGTDSGSTITITNTGVTSVAGTSNQVFVNGGVSSQTGAVTLSLPQGISTTSQPTFAGVISTVAFNANVTGTTIAFQTNNTNIQINGNGLISTVAGMNVNGSSFVDSSRNVSAGTIAGSTITATGNIQCGGSSNYGVAGGYFGQDATGGLVCGSVTLYFKGGILYAYV